MARRRREAGGYSWDTTLGDAPASKRTWLGGQAPETRRVQLGSKATTRRGDDMRKATTRANGKSGSA
ncbi:hypothetical protein GUJ93_ZPchr0009g1267 [Zizania palustris]|uniref:Uncharacterized protein n=1 Tax=Zizania palustris TaxID=103762 RepID=A0A8J5RB18_ZIZPA|nr:hypothetical protein GUJ93_ZPchr0009g1267 [Zizania palustris]